MTPARPDFGFNDNTVPAGFLTPAADTSLLEGIGAGLLRVTVDWRFAEPYPGVYDLAAYDRLYQAALARGIRLVLVPAYAPAWARGPLAPCGDGDGDCRRPPAERHLGAWQAFVGVIARRYPRAAAIEVWNEPNEWYYWQSGADPDRYTELLRLAYSAVKAVAPSMPVITGGLSDRWISSPGSRSRAAFLSGMYASGAAGHFDAIGVHVYPAGEGSDLTTPIDETRDVSRAFTGRAAPIWVTEVGATTTGDRAVSPARQASMLTTAYRVFRARHVKATLVHTLVDAGTDRRDRESGYGVLTRTLQPKPAYCAFAVAWAPASGCG